MKGNTSHRNFRENKSLSIRLCTTTYSTSRVIIVSITIEALAVDLAVHMTKRFRYRRKRGGILLVETGYPGALRSRRQVDRCQCASNVSPCQCRMDVWVALQSKSGEVVSNTKLGGYNA